MAEYQQVASNIPGEPPRADTILRVADWAYIPNDTSNADWRRYEEWLGLGNTPDPPDTNKPPLPPGQKPQLGSSTYDWGRKLVEIIGRY